MKKTSKQLYLIKILVATMLLPILISLLGLLIPIQFDQLRYTIFSLAGIFLILDVIIAIITMLYITINNLTLKEFYERLIIFINLNKAFISCKAYIDTIYGYVITPTINFEGNTIVIGFRNNPVIRKAIEEYKDSLSTALPKRLIVESVRMEKNQDCLIMEILNLEKDKYSKFNNPKELDDFIVNYCLTEIPIDKNHKFDLRKSSSAILTGPTGSGKTYGAFYLIYIFILKGYLVVCCDIKRTYVSLKNVAECAFSVEGIIQTLQNTVSLMMQRSEEMQSILAKNPNAIACDYGYEPIVVVIEEYIALVNMASTQQRKEINSLVRQLILMGRQLSVHTIILLQQAGAESLDTSIKSNCSLKMVYGNASESMYKTAFGLTDSTKIPYKLKSGEGVAVNESDKFLYHTPEINFSVQDLEEYIKK